MAAHIVVLVEELVSSDEENIDIQLPNPPVLHYNEDFDEIAILHPILGVIQRIEHVKISNYIENFVHNYSNIDFIMHFRLSREVTYQLIDQFIISDIFRNIEVRVEDTKISAEKHILAYLWFVGHQTGSYRDVADRFGITISALHTLITRVTDFISSLASNIIKYPNRQEKEETSNYFQQQKRFPRIIGAIDGSHIRIDRPIEDPDSYINRKQYYSIHIQGTVDHKLRFLDVFIGYPGSVHDARVFRNSTIYQDLPEICGDEFYFLADSAYPCLQYVIVPYRDNGHLTRPQKVFNQRLSSCRIVIENSFGCLKQRFRQLYHFKLRNIRRMVQVIHACSVLHNLANMQDLQYFEEPVNEEYPDGQLENQPVGANDDAVRDYGRGFMTGAHIRDQLCDLFSHQQ